MKPYNTQQEILLLITSGFSAFQQLNRESHKSDTRQLSLAENLEEACWSGLLNELVPGILQRSASGKDLYIWQVSCGTAFLQIWLSDVLPKADPVFSIDPQYFLPFQSCN